MSGRGIIVAAAAGLGLALALAGAAPAAQLRVMTTGLGSGRVESVPAGTVDCRASCDYTLTSAVVLRATADTGSTFAGWDVDPNGEPATTDRCTGTGDCSLTMSQPSVARPVFNLALRPLNRLPDPADATKQLAYTPTQIRDYLADPANAAVNSVARFLAILPAEFRQNWILMTRSESLQTGTAEFPRILLSSADARAVFTIGLDEHNAYPGAHPNAIEYMEFDAREGQKAFRFHEVVLAHIPRKDLGGDGIGVFEERNRGILEDEARCSKCHSTRNVKNPGSGAGTTGTRPGVVRFFNKPNWDTYDSWGGMAPFNRDRIYPGSLEAAALRRFFNPWTWRTNPEVRSIIEQLQLQPPGVRNSDRITRLLGGANDGRIRFDFDPATPPASEPAPTGDPLGGGLTRRTDITYAFDGLDGGATGGDTIERGGPAFVTLQHPATPTGAASGLAGTEGRGVQLFDLLGGQDGQLNGERIAAEIIDHRFATGSIPIDVRPIALAITRLDRCVRVNTAGTAAVSRAGMTALDTTGLTFLDSRHGMGIAQLIADTDARAKSMPIRKADIQKINLDRTNDIYLVNGEPTNGLIQQYGSATSFGTSTALARLRQEVFRRPIDAGSPDSTNMRGKYVDRETYGAAIQRTALYRYFLEPLGVSVDKWSMGVRGRSRTYSFADVFGDNRPVIDRALVASLTARRYVGHSASYPGMTDPTSCNQLIAAINDTLAEAVRTAATLPTYTDVQRIFNKGCIECHGDLDYPPYSNYRARGPAVTYSDTLDLSEEEMPTGGRDRLDRSHGVATSRSLLYQRVTGGGAMIDSTDPAKTLPYDPARVSEACPNYTGLMPCGGPPLSQADIMTLRRWLNGATPPPNTRGDPHIRTVGGVNYDFQAAGEYVLLRGRGFELQARHTAVETAGPLGPNGHTGLTSCVSVNTAAAVRVGDHRVTYQPRLDGEPDPDGLELRIDGERVGLDDGPITLEGGGRVRSTSAAGGIQIEAPGGTTVIVTPGWWGHYQLWYLNIDTRRVRATAGLMGEIAPGNWLPALPGGGQLGPMPKKRQDRYDVLYGEFGEAWRVDGETTLFDYAPGGSPADSHVVGWPRGESPRSCALPPQAPGPRAEQLPPTIARPAAEEHCAGVIGDAARDNCIQDVMVTGEPGFARTYELSERFELNQAPAAPELLLPADNQTAVALPVSFTWDRAADLDGDVVTYRHCVWPVGRRPDDNHCRQVTGAGGSAGPGAPGRPRLRPLKLLVALLLALLLLAVLLLVGVPKKPALVAAVVAFLLIGLLPRGPGSAVRPVEWRAADLEPGRAYYWKVIAEDERSGTVESATRRFELQ